MWATKIKFWAFVTLLTCGVLSNSYVKAQEKTAAKSDSTALNSIWFVWNTHALLTNYPALELTAQFNWKNKFSFIVGAGYIFQSEYFSSSEEFTQHKTGFSLIGEVKHYFNNNANNNGPYWGVGYRHLETSYSTNYIIRVTEQGSRYFKYFEDDYYIRQNQFYAKIGYRLTTQDKNLFFESGLNLGFNNKRVSPEPEKVNGKIVTNKKFLQGLSRYPLPFSIDVKIGIRLFNW